ncbi:DNA (cytosine-5-)-methyltransferase [Timonella sp. A28]|uniref:DNA (cytosine-5-)-methyltransferase n=1 Tax=Timonella sp. A28 TaxID=3442640 RepID=UPI003EBA50F9
MLKIGALFAGYAGIDLAVQHVLDAEIAWVSEIDKGPSKILAHRFPTIPNLGDITAINWSEVKPVDIITGGSPCQDLSHAGKRLGMKPGTRSGLWVSMLEAITTIKPKLVIWENVSGAFSAEATSAMESCAGCVGDGSTRPVLRALGRVLGDLTAAGYDAEWHSLEAADVGAPHHRLRVFVIAWPRTTGKPRVVGRSLVSDTEGNGRETYGLTSVSQPTLTRFTDSVRLLPTPAVNDMGAGKDVEAWDAWTDRMKQAHGNGNGHGKSLHIEALRLLPTPTAERTDGRKSQAFREGRTTFYDVVYQEKWGEYAPAIKRWETITRPAPAPTLPTGKEGKRQLSPRFVEWMMGLPDGWVTSVPDMTRSEQLKALGNGVVPLQAAEAIRRVLTPNRGFSFFEEE